MSVTSVKTAELNIHGREAWLVKNLWCRALWFSMRLSILVRHLTFQMTVKKSDVVETRSGGVNSLLGWCMSSKDWTHAKSLLACH